MRRNNHSLVKYQQIVLSPDASHINIARRVFDHHLKTYLDANRIAYELDDLFARVPSDSTTVEALRDYHISRYEADVWYPVITKDPEGSKLTFASEFIELNAERLDMLVALSDDKNVKEGPVYRSLIRDLDAVFDKFKQHNVNKLFVKLNSVSPKDLCVYFDGPYGDIDALAAYRSEHVPHMLTRSTRTMSVIRNPRAPVHIMLREFADVPVQDEYRCFIYDNKLRAISQYHWNVQRPELLDQRFAIRDRISNFMSQVLQGSYLPYADCIVDVILAEPSEKTFGGLGIYIVECNCFGADLVAGSALYNWDVDYEILYHNPGPADIRVAAMFEEDNLY
jgi:D123